MNLIQVQKSGYEIIHPEQPGQSRAKLYYIVRSDNPDTMDWEVYHRVFLDAPEEFPAAPHLQTWPRREIEMEYLGGQTWHVVVNYEGKDPGFQETFDTTGGTSNMKCSYYVSSVYKRPGTPTPPLSQAIGEHDGNVEGVDIVVPTFSFKETHLIPKDEMTPGYKRLLMENTGCVNMFPFRGWDGGEVLFLGVTGAFRPPEDWELTFSFAVSPTRRNFSVGDIQIAVKDGWDYLDVRFQEVSEGIYVTKQPTYAYVHKVYPRVDFEVLGIPEPP